MATLRESGAPPAESVQRRKFLTPFTALAEPNYRWLWSGQLAASVGRSMRSYLRLYLVYELTGSAVWLGIVQGSLALPFLFLTFWGGVLADRMDRRRLLVVTEIMLVVLWALVSTLIVAGLINEWWLAGAAVISGTVQSFSRPARQALVPNVVSRPNLANAVALESTAQSGGTLAGPAIGGVLASIAFIDIGGAFWVTTALQGYTVVSILMMQWQFQGEMPARRQSAGRSFLEGLGHMRSDVLILGLVMMGAAGSLFAGSYHSLLPVFAKDVLHVGRQELGLMVSTAGVGAITGGLFTASLSHVKRRGLLLAVGGLGYAATLFFFALSTHYALTIVLLLVVGTLSMTYNTINNTILQLIAPEAMRGRIMGARTFVFGLAPFGLIPLTALAQATSAPFAVGLGATLFAVALGVLLLRIPKLRTFTAS
ncbi:MAG: MFS transporter [Chloroflexi bacterium]|nr:MFS transporter [Chloroflexota bacterium]